VATIQAAPQSVGSRDPADAAAKHDNSLCRSVTSIGH